MTQPNQHSFTRSQLRRDAREGRLTPERIAQYEDAAKRGQVHRDGEAIESPPQPKAPPQVGGTEISAQRTAVRLPWWLR